MGSLRLALAVVGASLTLLTGTAVADSSYYVTFVARQCPSYSDIYATAARNDQLQSLQNLRPGRRQGDGQAFVDPAREDTGRQLSCRPLPHWAFTLGTGRENRGVTGAWGSLSRVSNPYATSIVTKPSTLLLNAEGRPIPGAPRIRGAVTIELTAAQLARAEKPGGLWVQGGSPADPVLARAHGTPRAPNYGFGTLQCANDEANADNTEQLLFPAGSNHVFCYAYYVTSPPASGTLVVREQAEGGQAGAHPAFPFNGSTSYASGGFTLRSGRSIALHRAGGMTWTVTQPPVAHYRLASVRCTSETGGSVATVGGSTASVALAAGDTVTCTFVSRWVRPVGSLTIFEVTEGGVGSFSFIVEPHDDPTLVRATTNRSGVPVEARPERDLALLAAELYSVQQFPSADSSGRWALVGAECDGAALKLNVYALRLVNARNTVCTLTNRLIPAGSIRLSSLSQGGTGTAAFVIQSIGASPRQFRQSSTTRHEGVAAAAVPDRRGDATAHILRGRYLITEQLPLTAPADSSWALSAVSCNRAAVPFSRGTAIVTLTHRVSHLNCRFTNTLHRRDSSSVLRLDHNDGRHDPAARGN